MAEIGLSKVEQGPTKLRNVPIAVTPEGFWCCPSPAVFQKNSKSQNSLNKSKSSSPPPPKTTPQKKQVPSTEKKPTTTNVKPGVVSDDPQTFGLDDPTTTVPVVPERVPKPKVESVTRKVAIEFGEPGTSDIKVILLGKQGFCVKMSVHRKVLVENSKFFADKLSEHESDSPSLDICNCEDVEVYVETVGLMYCKEMKQRLIKQNVSRVLRILKVAELLAFNSCIQTCLEYLEAVPWVGEDEEEKVVSSVLHLQGEGIGVTPVLKRVYSDVPNPPKDTISHIMELVLKSNEEKGRREMKSVVLKLLKENSTQPNRTTSGISSKTIYTSCRSCLNSLLHLFKQAAEPESKQIALEVDNLLWLLEILIVKQAADEFALIWSSQEELAVLHSKLPITSRYHVSCITARLFVGIGKGELLPSKDTRSYLLKTWFEPLINDYNWLNHGCRSFDRKVVEEGIGRTILTLPLEDQQRILLSWMGSFLKGGDNCPNLQRAFEVWWRRTFIRPYVDTQGNSLHSDSSSS